MEEIDVAIRCAKNIEELTRPMVERLWKRIFLKRMKMATGPSVIA
jgi:hypothetical protein